MSHSLVVTFWVIFPFLWMFLGWLNAKIHFALNPRSLYRDYGRSYQSIDKGWAWAVMLFWPITIWFNLFQGLGHFFSNSSITTNFMKTLEPKK